ncbi:unnamed protein product [Merluccius merluccius]
MSARAGAIITPRLDNSAAQAKPSCGASGGAPRNMLASTLVAAGLWVRSGGGGGGSSRRTGRCPCTDRWTRKSRQAEPH